jgi:AcrR family transcriptional regulator
MTDNAVDTALADTQTKILDAAECLFAEHGYAATSLRKIASAAGVNLAATHYYFGSKKGLLASVFHRCVQPINEERLFLLQQLTESDHPLTIRSVLESFFAPLVEAVYKNHRVPVLIGRIYAEPESLTKPILEQEFGKIAARYQLAIAEVFPHLPTEELSWRFHFMIGSMIHLLQFNAPLGTESSYSTFISGIDRMLDYAEAGFTQPNERPRHD